MSNKTNISYMLGGLVLGVVGIILFQSVMSNGKESSLQNSSANEPLYWVAPMDPNFKRDKPGKSPMGMDLVAVFADNNIASEGTITISANVESNLGVKTSKVERVKPTQTIYTTGDVQYDQDALVHVHSRTEGWIEKLYVGANGDYVEKGAPLYSLYSPELVNAQEEYLIALQQGNLRLISAAQKRLAALRVPQLVISELKQSKEAQQKIIFRSPQSGVVDSLNIREGFYVNPSATLMAIAGLSEVWIQAQILARDSENVKIGQSVEIRSSFMPGQTLEGTVALILPQVNPKTRTVEARIRMPNPDYVLKPNMFVDISIDLNSTAQSQIGSVLAIPKEAVIRTGRQNRVVLALGNGEFKSIEVSLGKVFDDHIEILSGLVEGDLVVRSAQFLLDSESSINSDFSRMQSTQATSMSDSANNESEVELARLSVWTQATINEIMPDERKLNISHGELALWNMPGMTMDFLVADDIDMNDLEEDMEIHVEVTKTDMGMFSIKTIHTPNDMKATENVNHD